MTEHTHYEETKWEEYLFKIRPHVKGCPEKVIVNAVRDSAIEFCEKTTIWRHQLDPITIEKAKAEYELFDFPDDTRIHTPVHIEDDGNPLTPTTPEELNLQWPRFGGKWPIDRLDTIPAVPWREFEEEDAHFYYMKDRPDLLRLVGIPTKQKIQGLTVTVALKPLTTATGMPDFIFHDWYRTIADGALFILLAMPDEKWTNDKKAAFHGTKYTDGLEDADGRIGRAYTRHDGRPLRTRPFFR